MKLANYVIMLLTMMIILEFIGLPTGLSSILNSFGVNINSNTGQLISADIGNSTFWNWIFANTGILVLVSAFAAVIVGLFAKSFDTSLVIAPFIVSLASLMIGTFSGLISYAASIGQNWTIAIIVTIFIPIAAGFIMACLDEFAGR